jgi:hypothetical protein
MARTLSVKRLAGAVACVAAAGVAALAPAIVVAGLIVAVLAAIIGAEQVSGARRRGRGEPSPLERLEAGTGAR